MSYIYFNSLSRDEDFWKDVAEAPKRIMIKKNTLGLHFNVLNPNRLKKFEQFIHKQHKAMMNQTQEVVSPKKLKEKIDRMLLLGKKKEDIRKRIYEQHMKEKESIEVSQCTFHPNIHQIHSQLKKTKTQMHNKGGVSSPLKIRNEGYYEKSQLWSRNLKGKKAKMKQKMYQERKEYTFTPSIHQRSLDMIFNKVQSEFILPQNANYLRTKANNLKKRQSSSQMNLTQSGEKKGKTASSSRSASFLCSIEILKNELRNSSTDLNEKDEE